MGVGELDIIMMFNNIYFGWETVATIFLVFITLKWFYTVFQVNWPQYYFSSADATSFFIRNSLFRFLFFKIIPPAIIMIFYLSVFMRDYNRSSMIFAAVTSMLMFISFTDGDVLFQLLFKRRDVKVFFNKYSQIVFHLFVIVILLIIGAMCGYYAKNQMLSYIIPSYSALRDTLWATFIGFLLASYFRDAISATYVSENEIINKSIKEINPELLKYIDEVSKNNNANRNLVKAICVTENLQRPKWIRTIEKIKSLLIKEGTYGIMQVRSNKYIDDRESIKMSVEKYFKDTVNISDAEELSRIIKNYNNDTVFLDVVLKALSHFQP